MIGIFMKRLFLFSAIDMVIALLEKLEYFGKLLSL